LGFTLRHEEYLIKRRPFVPKRMALLVKKNIMRSYFEKYKMTGNRQFATDGYETLQVA
jgi:hypothetical protein